MAYVKTTTMIISRRQHEHEFNFTPVELSYLLTTQRLVEKKMENQKFNPEKLDDEFLSFSGDIQNFGWALQDAMDEGATKLSVKMGVLYLLTSVWRSMSNLGNKLDFPEGTVPFNKEEISEMHDMLWNYYKANAQGK
ncbi:hypothetical protein QMK33_12135 [Hymenobacter sp. H14-R3]|uniref:hypothetical protein n=1 Tax=Hymenobacter sp. H14-R3 TaxID=3046308 RepID=UPI0024B885FB|nr:hypothetical protein [Hymenobacter sp. H14-R3]MDJ0365903.1 hypothetical protein [Hymenobacter sp. H14-R3]